MAPRASKHSFRAHSRTMEYEFNGTIFLQSLNWKRLPNAIVNLNESAKAQTKVWGHRNIRWYKGK